VIPSLVILVNTITTIKETSMINPWNNLLVALDTALGFPNRQDSIMKKLYQGYDNKTNEHVMWIEYRDRVNPGDRRTEGIRPGSLLEALVR
jgi:hypothetical protein